MPAIVGECLQEAHRLITGDRNASYGDFYDECRRMATVLTALRGKDFSPIDVATMLVVLKLSREQNSHKRDNCVDGAAYFDLLNYTTEREQERIQRLLDECEGGNP
jgi:hypothetical protein